MKVKKLRKVEKVKKQQLWDEMPWKSLDIDQSQFPETDNTDQSESMFFGLEVLDGNQYLLEKGSDGFKPLKKQTEKANLETNDENKKEKTKKRKVEKLSEDFDDSPAIVEDGKEKSKKKTKKTKSKTIETSAASTPRQKPENTLTLPTETREWNGITLHTLLTTALLKMGFFSPTPIQSAAVPHTVASCCDVVGAAETGSGKTLAFGLPILNSLLTSWDELKTKQSPHSIIIAPTRELAMQISNVLKEICNNLIVPGREGQKPSKIPIQVASIVGGMSEHKQLRILGGGKNQHSDSDFKPVHIIVATPGRFCEILESQGDELKALQDLSCIRFLVLDEADRMVEEGHFPELHRIFSRITDHEEVRYTRGLDPREHSRRQKIGTFEEDFFEKKQDESEEIPENLGELEFLAENGIENEFQLNPETSVQSPESPEIDHTEINKRQTLLFSATAIDGDKGNQGFKKKGKKLKLKGTLVGVTEKSKLPENLKQLLCLVAVQPKIHLIDVTKTQAESNKTLETSIEEGIKDSSAVSLPANLEQFELLVPAEEKDTYAYYYLFKHPGRTMIFVNSIKTARRLDGLLRALKIPCRALHAQLTQKQRLKALEGFQGAPVGVLVCTDVAARGLDVQMINSVIHYDVARSPQMYVHRSGRTARANKKGTTVSLVSPEDTTHHRMICQYLQLGKGSSSCSFPNFKLDLSYLPMLRERIKLAKKIFTNSFVASQEIKDKNWLKQQIDEADLPLDAHIESELTPEINPTGTKKEDKLSLKRVEELKRQLNVLLDTGLEKFQANSKNSQIRIRNGKKPKKSTIAMMQNKNQSSLKKGFFVYAK